MTAADTPSHSVDPPVGSTTHARRTGSTALLAAWLVLLVAVPASLAFVGWPRYHTSNSVLAESIDWLTLAASVGQALLLAAGRYALLGMILAGFARRSLAAAVGALVVGIAIAAAVESIDALAASQSPALDAVVLASVSLLIGLAIGVPWSAGRRGLASFIVAVVLIAPVAVAGWLAFSAVVDTEPPIDMADVTSADKRRITDTLKKHASSAPDQPNIATVTFTWHDLRVMAAWACDVVAPSAKADLRPIDGDTQLSASAELPGRRYASVDLLGSVAIDQSDVRIDWRSVRFGNTQVPAILARLVTPVIYRCVRQDIAASNALSMIEQLRLDESGLAVVYDREAVPDDAFAQLTGGGADPELVDRTRHYVKTILDAAPQPRNDQGFAAFYAAAFAEAQRRSVDGDPVAENRAAILGLAVTLGHPSLARFIGPVVDPADEARMVRFTYPKLKRRSDWSQHFSLSAGIAVLSSVGVSDAVGLLKEERDAGPGGSGFSFTDLAADRAGTRFGTLAVATAGDAITYQNLLAKGFDTGILCPELWDLPEGLSESAFETRYGSVGSPAYESVIDEIERRLNALPALN